MNYIKILALLSLLTNLTNAHFLLSMAQDSGSGDTPYPFLPSSSFIENLHRLAQPENVHHGEQVPQAPDARYPFLENPVLRPNILILTTDTLSQNNLPEYPSAQYLVIRGTETNPQLTQEHIERLRTQYPNIAYFTFENLRGLSNAFVQETLSHFPYLAERGYNVVRPSLVTSENTARATEIDAACVVASPHINVGEEGEPETRPEGWQPRRPTRWLTKQAPTS